MPATLPLALLASWPGHIRTQSASWTQHVAPLKHSLLGKLHVSVWWLSYRPHHTPTYVQNRKTSQCAVRTFFFPEELSSGWAVEGRWSHNWTGMFSNLPSGLLLSQPLQPIFYLFFLLLYIQLWNFHWNQNCRTGSPARQLSQIRDYIWESMWIEMLYEESMVRHCRSPMKLVLEMVCSRLWLDGL